MVSNPALLMWFLVYHKQGRKLSPATTASTVDALQLAEVPLKIYPSQALTVVPLSSATGPFEGFDAYDDKWFTSTIKYVSGKKM